MRWIEAWIILGLILLNGFFAASELALVSAHKARLRARAERGERGAQVALRLLEDPTRLLSTIQFGITLIGILTGVYSGAVFADDLAGPLRRVPWLARYADETAYAVVVIVVTYLSLVLGELVPKRLALAHAERFAIFVARPMQWVAFAGAPLVWLLRVSTEAVAKLLPFRAAQQASVTEDEVRHMIAAGAREGVFLKREKELIEGVLRLADRSVESVMVPRGDIVWLDVSMPVREMWEEARASGHARFPVCDGEIERMIGVITLGDLGESLLAGRLDLQKVLMPEHVPSNISLLRLLELFQSSSVRLAIVTDEYGDVLGLVTASDILRAIAGELPDTGGGRERAHVVRREDGSWLIDGHLSIHELERLLERGDLAQGDDYHTVAGFVLWHLGRVPAAGERLTWRDLCIEVVDMDGPRIDKVLIVPHPCAASGELAGRTAVQRE